MAKMLAAAYGRNQAERPDCCRDDDKFRGTSGRGTVIRKQIQRAREREDTRREIQAALHGIG